jgi:hypothetical protein
MRLDRAVAAARLVRRRLVLGLAGLLAGGPVGVARGDGDTASDVLPSDTVYFPLSAPSGDATRR